MKDASDSMFVGFRAPTEIVQTLKRRAQEEDTDLSKFIRRALRRELVASGYLSRGKEK